MPAVKWLNREPIIQSFANAPSGDPPQNRAIGRWGDGREVFSLAEKIVPAVEWIAPEIIDKTVELMDTYPQLLVRDYPHAAHCIFADLEGCLQLRCGFRYNREIRRIEPEIYRRFENERSVFTRG